MIVDDNKDNKSSRKIGGLQFFLINLGLLTIYSYARSQKGSGE